MINSHVAIFGIGGVGSFAAEAITRSGVGNITLIDGDVVELTNINRQLIADVSTIGMKKVDLMKARINKINIDAKVYTFDEFYNQETLNPLDFSRFDYIIDAIDQISAKILIISRADQEDIPIVSCMGTGNKLNPLKFEVDDVYNTSVCPLAKIMRRELKKVGIKKLKVIYSKEQPVRNEVNGENTAGKYINSSIAFVPSVAGLILAGEVVRDLIKN